MSRRMLVGLIGINIGQSLAPALHEDAFAAAGMTGHYHLMDADTPRSRSLPDLLAAYRDRLLEHFEPFDRIEDANAAFEAGT